MATKPKPAQKPTLPENVSETGGKGWRKCEKCNLYTQGGRTKVCANPDCGAEFPTKEKTTTKKTGLSMREQAELRIAEIDQILSSRDTLELEREKLQELLEILSE